MSEAMSSKILSRSSRKSKLKSVEKAVQKVQIKHKKCIP